ncbi:MAG: hypothetical protein ABI230_00555 [Aestuariivirga sp.]
MTRLTTRQRNALPDSAFGLPETRGYPMPDAIHARNAKARASEEHAAGKLTTKDLARIDRMADEILSKLS